ncbi:protein meaA [Polycladidibacter stylochi]|uniref:protein meaA n=1 Tax=Polycladidibacter stylochi TaxID=1807766 RepID=UPI0008299C94|nr:protein meaA [Pseudovibrio stylochi]
MKQQIKRDRPWLFRTYAGHSSAQESNQLFRSNLAKGQTGLSIAFDLPTQTGYDPDHVLSKGEVGKVGVPIAHLGDMQRLFDGIPLEKMNTSMTINATAPWLLALYIAVADEQGADRKLLSGTTQNDLIKEYLSRGTYVFPPTPSLGLTCDVITWTYENMPKWNPTNVCSYHLQEAGAEPVQELAFALATATSVLDRVRQSGVIAEDDFPKVVGRISFFVNAGMKFITEMSKMRAFTELWDEICRERYGIENEKYRRFRYGVQVNSLGLTEQQPENNVARILIEMLAVTLSKNARARAVQLPAWNEALGLPRPIDQQWSLRMQQVLAYETDLLDFDDIFEGSHVIESKVAALKEAALSEMRHIEEMGGTIQCVESGYMKQQLVESNAQRVAKIEAGEQVVVGVNRWAESEASPLVREGDASFLSVDDNVELQALESLEAWRRSRDDDRVQQALAKLREAAREGRNVMPASIDCAKAGVTTGEWGATLRAVHGEYRAPTGVGQAARNDVENLEPLRNAVSALSRKMGCLPKVLVGKPGLDGHSNGAEQIAVRARDGGMQVVYDGIRLSPADIVASVKQEKPHIVGLSILSGSHVALVQETLRELRAQGLEDTPVVVGGIIPEEDALALKNAGVEAVYTPKDFDISNIIEDLLGIIEHKHISVKTA